MASNSLSYSGIPDGSCNNGAASVAPWDFNGACRSVRPRRRLMPTEGEGEGQGEPLGDEGHDIFTFL